MMKPLKYTFGSDPGVTNIGFSFVRNEDRQHALMYLVDLSCYSVKDENDFKYHSIKLTDLGALVHDLVKMFHEMFLDTDKAGVELQPPKGNPVVKFFSFLLHQTLSVKYSHMRVCFVRPKEVRSFWGISGKDYRDRKKKSWETNAVGEKDIVGIRNQFKKDGEHKVDPLEATLLAIYLKQNAHKVSMCESNGGRDFDVRLYSCPISETPKKKKRLAVDDKKVESRKKAKNG